MGNQSWLLPQIYQHSKDATFRTFFTKSRVNSYKAFYFTLKNSQGENDHSALYLWIGLGLSFIKGAFHICHFSPWTYLCHFTSTSHRPIPSCKSTLLFRSTPIYIWCWNPYYKVQGSRFDALVKIVDICLGLVYRSNTWYKIDGHKYVSNYLAASYLNVAFFNQ